MLVEHSDGSFFSPLPCYSYRTHKQNAEGYSEVGESRSLCHVPLYAVFVAAEALLSMINSFPVVRTHLRCGSSSINAHFSIITTGHISHLCSHLVSWCKVRDANTPGPLACLPFLVQQGIFCASLLPDATSPVRIETQYTPTNALSGTASPADALYPGDHIPCQRPIM